MIQVVTPAQIEARLYALSKEVDEAHNELVETEAEYHRVKSQYEIAMAQQRINYAQRSTPTGKNSGGPNSCCRPVNTRLPGNKVASAMRLTN